GYISRGIVSFNVDGFSSDEIGNILSEDYEICVRTGYHCSPYVHNFINSIQFNGTVRVSLGIFNTKSDIDSLIQALKEIIL
ncbi:MAG: aminotransferase class V-fold PLP-dependent enzyme, partial [Turicibacter sp.]|nr:aminotransferase class V-fold PLP-dependent enzyme [Turicibacter sp.]